jgi:hypothetical protein
LLVQAHITDMKGEDLVDGQAAQLAAQVEGTAEQRGQGLAKQLAG